MKKKIKKKTSRAQRFPNNSKSISTTDASNTTKRRNSNAAAQEQSMERSLARTRALSFVEPEQQQEVERVSSVESALALALGQQDGRTTILQSAQHQWRQRQQRRDIVLRCSVVLFLFSLVVTYVVVSRKKQEIHFHYLFWKEKLFGQLLQVVDLDNLSCDALSIQTDMVTEILCIFRSLRSTQSPVS
jgi:hypothetical protein